jgi:hypothetical protein
MNRMLNLAYPEDGVFGFLVLGPGSNRRHKDFQFLPPGEGEITEYRKVNIVNKIHKLAIAAIAAKTTL